MKPPLKLSRDEDPDRVTPIGWNFAGPGASSRLYKPGFMVADELAIVLIGWWWR